VGHITPAGAPLWKTCLSICPAFALPEPRLQLGVMKARCGGAGRKTGRERHRKWKWSRQPFKAPAPEDGAPPGRLPWCDEECDLSAEVNLGDIQGRRIQEPVGVENEAIARDGLPSHIQLRIVQLEKLVGSLPA